MNLIKNFNIAIIRKAMELMGKKKKLFLGCIFLFCALEILCTLLKTIGVKDVITATLQKDFNLFSKSIIFIVISNVLWWIYAPISSYLCALSSKKTIADFKTNFCQHVIDLPMKYHDTKSKGEVLSAISNDAACLQDIYDWSFFEVLHSAIGGLAGIIIMAFIDWRFAIVVVFFGTLSVFVSSYFSKRLECIGKELQERISKTNTDTYQLIKAAKTIRLLKLFSYQAKNFEEDAKDEGKIKEEVGRETYMMKGIVTSISAISYILILFTGALFVYFRLSNWGKIIAVAELKYTTDMLFQECGQFMAAMQINVAGVKRLLAIGSSKKEEIKESTSFIIDNINNPLSIRNISFSYEEGINIIKNFSMELENKKLTVLVGKSGAGKSTIMKLLLGLYEPSEGSIIFSGKEGVTLEMLRNKTAYVPQEPLLFRGSIYENIACGNENATKDEVISAAILSGVDKFICKFEKGYETVILDDGKSLSGGQKQRVAVARALIKNSPILLLDEITSALDKENEKYILETIKDISKFKTVLFITHNGEVVKWADKIIYVE